MQDRRCVCVFLPNDDTLNVIVNVSTAPTFTERDRTLCPDTKEMNLSLSEHRDAQLRLEMEKHLVWLCLKAAAHNPL